MLTGASYQTLYPTQGLDRNLFKDVGLIGTEVNVGLLLPLVGCCHLCCCTCLM